MKFINQLHKFKVTSGYQQPPINSSPANLADKISNLNLSGQQFQQQPKMQPPLQANSLIPPPMPLAQNRNESPLSFNSSVSQTAPPPQSNQFNQFAMNGRPALQRPPG